jgi:hypothetical protein
MSTYLRICLAVGVAFAAAPTWAEEIATQETSPRLESPRALNGHVFQPSRLITGPFSTTSFGEATQFGVGEAEAPRFNLQGQEIGTRDYPVAAFGQALDLHLRVTPDIALRLDLNGVVFSGINGRGILVAGATAQYGVLAGVTAGRDLGPTTRLAFVADFGVQPQYSILVGNAVLQAIQTQSFDEGGVFSKVNRARAAPGVSFAWAPSPVLGFEADARYVWTRRVSSEDDGSDRTAQGVSLGGLVSVDLEPLMRWPFAVQASYRGDLPVGGNGIVTVHQVGAGVYYSRRVELALGLEVIWRHGQIRPGQIPTLRSDSAIAALILRYYW